MAAEASSSSSGDAALELFERQLAALIARDDDDAEARLCKRQFAAAVARAAMHPRCKAQVLCGSAQAAADFIAMLDANPGCGLRAHPSMHASAGAAPHERSVTIVARDPAAECEALAQHLRPLLLRHSLRLHARGAFQARILEVLPAHLPCDWGVAVPVAAAHGGVVVFAPHAADEEPRTPLAADEKAPLRHWDVWHTRHSCAPADGPRNPRYHAAFAALETGRAPPDKVVRARAKALALAAAASSSSSPETVAPTAPPPLLTTAPTPWRPTPPTAQPIPSSALDAAPDTAPEPTAGPLVPRPC